MSTLTKVFAVLVSILSIFLCGTIVTFLANAQDWKTKALDSETIAQAAQVQALAAQERLTRNRMEHEKYGRQLQEGVNTLHQQLDDRTRQLASALQKSSMETSRAETAVATMGALRDTIQSMHEGQEHQQVSLNDTREKMISAQTQKVELTQKLNRERVLTDQLESIRKRNLEKIHVLEEEIAAIHQKLEQVTLTSKDFGTGGRVTLTSPQLAGVPIRGQITDIDGQNMAISVGSSSGVRKHMRFWIIRGDKYLGNLEIIHVESDESVGRLTNQEGVVVMGDRITSDFN